MPSTRDGAQTGDNISLFFRGFETAQHFHVDGEHGHSFPKRLGMLERKNRGGDEHGDLFPLHDGLEGGTNGDLGFSDTGWAGKKQHAARALIALAGSGGALAGALGVMMPAQLLLWAAWPLFCSPGWWLRQLSWA